MKNLMKVAAPMVGAGLMVVGIAAADGRPRLDPALALARLCVNEAGWECWETRDGYAIHEVLLRGADREHLSYTAFASSYARRLFGRRPHDSARIAWTSQLNARGTVPEAWPTYIERRTRDGQVRTERHAPWSAYRERWLAVLAEAQRVVNTPLPEAAALNPCVSEIHDWGGPEVDRERAERLGLIRVECGDEIRNDFYQRPSLMRGAE